jgi:hypothetical protein
VDRNAAVVVSSGDLLAQPLQRVQFFSASGDLAWEAAGGAAGREGPPASVLQLLRLLRREVWLQLRCPD